ncbi:RXT2-like protein [Trichoderma chlorosporum]
MTQALGSGRGPAGPYEAAFSALNDSITDSTLLSPAQLSDLLVSADLPSSALLRLSFDRSVGRPRDLDRDLDLDLDLDLPTMASQQVLFAETIAGMKKAFKRRAYESDSDSEIESFTNRGNKLKKRARFAHKGQLMPTAGPGAYKETVEYAGVRRSIIHRNPPLVDDDGYEFDSDDDESRVEEAILSAAELNPYANIRLEHILAPLTASTDLPTHPVLSKPFTSNTLTELVKQSSGIMQRENRSLWQVRHLWTSLCGDATWVPCATMVGTNDIDFYTKDNEARQSQDVPKAGDGVSSPTRVNGEEKPGVSAAPISSSNAPGKSNEQGTAASADADVPMDDAESPGKRKSPPKQGDAMETDDGTSKEQPDEAEDAKKENGKSITNGDTGRNTNGREASTENTSQGRTKGSRLPSEDVQMQDSIEQTNKASRENPEAKREAEASYIHPMFLPPSNASLDRNLGLPDNEADDIRRLLALYVQKQEEVCRGAARLHMGLLRAQRLRKDVLDWSKAEAHCGPNRDMSDGEDWYDKEEWGLTEDLKKGQDEEEEDTATAGKKTRNRR